ncbi:phosphatidylcholine synthase [Azospirillum halopraeferens]|uniref:phosphatidylcholine synthase n=1 Tax=Azospirillum halopraeferens TaxID=34010 RepID=UPI00041BC679|nr:phosphatidylcholine/phosphatidylserine synthase [Azospirillum halopraeferens]
MESDRAAMDMERQSGGYGITHRLSAWAVHIFTGSGVVLGLLALLAIVEGNPRMVFLWLGIALVVDGVDGTFARRAKVKDVLPAIDGSALDLVIDYMTYVVVPAVFLYWFGLLPPHMGLVGAGWILLTSLYCFANTGMKSSDNYFVGFPAIWNVVALYLWLLDLDPWFNVAVIAVLGLLTFTPVKFLHPFRVRTLMTLNIVVVSAWLVSGAWLVVTYPERPGLVFGVWLATSAYYAVMCLWRTVRGPG